MKKLISILIFVLLFTMSYVCNAETEEPKIIWNSYKAFPGDTININGADFENLKGVKIQAINDNTEADINKARYALEIFTADESTIQGIIPLEIPRGLYAMWIITDKGTSKTIFVNRPEIVNIPVENVVVGQSVKMSGRNYLNPAKNNADDTRVKLKNQQNGKEFEAKLTYVSEYSVEFIVPEEIEADALYTIMYSNGTGGNSGWVSHDLTECEFYVENSNSNYDYIKENFGMEAFWLKNIDVTKKYNAKDYGIEDDKENSQTEKIQEFLDMVDENGGGLVYFPEGTYLIGHIDLPGSVLVYGDGQNKTVFEYDNSEKPWEVFKAHTFVYGETINMINAPESYVAMFNLSIINNCVRPESDWGYRIGGFVRPLQMGVKYKQFRLGQGITENSSGYYLKNVTLDTLDGSGVSINSDLPCVIDSCHIDATHTAAGVGTRTMMKDSYFYNEQRPCIDSLGSYVWLENCTLEAHNSGYKREQRWTDLATYTGDRPVVKTWPAMEHRYFDMGAKGYYVANNTVLGDVGTREPISHNDGEGFLTQWTSSNKGQGENLHGAVSEANEKSFTDRSHTDLNGKSYKNWYVIITYGRGAGQLRQITSHTNEGYFEINKAWDVIPDETSRYTIDWFCGNKHIWVHNEALADTRKGAFMVYTKGFDYTISNNITRDSSGILLGSSTRTNGLFLSYYITIDNNLVTRDKLGKKPDGGYGYMLSIGYGNDGGGSGNEQDGYFNDKPDYVAMFNEFRNNRISLGEKFIPQEITSSNEQFFDYSGITVAPQFKSGFPKAKGYIVEGNEVINTGNGVRIGDSALYTVISKNNLVNNDYKYGGGEGEHTIIIEEGYDAGKTAQNAGIDKNVYYK